MDIKPKLLDKYIMSDNIAEFLEPDVLSSIGGKVTKGYDIDLESRSERDELNKKAMKLAEQTYERKTFPWDGAANVKYPLITVATVQFASRALPELIPNHRIANFQIVGKDPDKKKEERSERLSTFMDYQLTKDIDGWVDDMDKMLHNLPIMGDCFKKVYYSGLDKKVVVDFLTCDDVVVNKKAKSLKTTRRITHKFYKYDNDIIERVNSGLWLDEEIGYAKGEDEDEPHLILEQHRWLDLDEDGYEEPYIVTVHKESGKVLRIVARYDADSLVLKDGKLIKINPIHYFVKYKFIPSLDNSFYDIGFGTLLYPINDSINTLVNQLLDAGTLANTGGGFLGRGVKMRGGKIKFAPGEWKVTDVMSQDLRQGILPLPIRDPSQVLFQLLGLLISAGKDISSVQDAMAGQKPGENVSAATVTALIEQGLKVFSGIYKRIYRSLSEELKMIYALNFKYGDVKKYEQVVDVEVEVGDFTEEGFDLIPSADPEFSLDIQRVGKAEALLNISGRPGLDEDAVTAEYLKAIKAPPEMMTPPDKRKAQPPNPDMERIKIEYGRLKLDQDKSNLEKMKLFAQIEELRAKAIKFIASAEAEELGQQLDEYKVFVDELGKEMEGMKNANGEGVQGMERKRNNQEGSQNPNRAEGGTGQQLG